jgi:hypothetical protein
MLPFRSISPCSATGPLQKYQAGSSVPRVLRQPVATEPNCSFCSAARTHHYHIARSLYPRDMGYLLTEGLASIRIPRATHCPPLVGFPSIGQRQLTEHYYC